MNPITRSIGDFTIGLMPSSDPDLALNGRDLDNVFAYLSGDYRGDRYLCGRRSVFIPAASSLPYNGIKIKGCGYEGGTVRFGRRHETDYPLPRYDYEGNFMMDAAKNMNATPSGGMSYQQATTERLVSEAARRAGIPVPPALGHGWVRRGGHTSWFCLLNFPFAKPGIWFEDVKDEERAVEIARFSASSQKRFGELGIYLLLLGRTTLDGQIARKDFHTAHFAGPNDSFMTLLCYTLFDTNFILYLFKRAFRLRGVGDFTDATRVAYVEELTGRRFTVAEIDRFKRLLLRFKYGPGKIAGILPRAAMDLEDRVSVLKSDPIASILLEDALARHAPGSPWQPVC